MRYRRSDNYPVRARQRGAALIVAMLIFALAASLMVAMDSEFNRYFQRSANLLNDEQTQVYLRGGEDLAVMVLIEDYDSDKDKGVFRDDLEERWARISEQPPFALADGRGWMAGEMEDLQGRFNLNLLIDQVPEGSPPDVRFTPAQGMFIRLLQALGEPEVSEQEAIAITESISDWLDANAEPLRDGAEDTFYFSQTPAYRAGNRLFASVTELRAVANMTPEIFAALRPYVSALPESDTRLNIHTAQAMLLRTLNADKDLSPLTQDEGESLFEETFEDLNAFLESPVLKDRAKDIGPDTRRLLGTSSSYFLLKARGELAGREMRLYSVLKRGNRQVGAIARANSPL